MRLLATINRAWRYLVGPPWVMTETEWLTGTNPVPMLEYLGRGVSDRKLRLFACAFCRRFWSVLDERGRAIVETAERFAEGTVSPQELAAVRHESPAVLGTHYWSEEAFTIHHAAVQTLDEDAWHAAFHASSAVVIFDRTTWDRENVAQCGLLRCLFGNPFATVGWNSDWPSWHEGLLVSMARQMYESRDFTEMLWLADALEEAGCTDAGVLNHCRQPGEHVRGCWVVDCLLGKT